MADPASRKSATLSRLRSQLRRKRESLADQFDFKMYIAVVFKDKKKKSALFEMAEVIPVMTNNYEDSILKGVQFEVPVHDIQDILKLVFTWTLAHIYPRKRRPY